MVCEDKHDVPGDLIKFTQMKVHPPYSLSLRHIEAGDFWKQNERGDWLFASYTFDDFVSFDCETIDPVPDAQFWIKRGD